MDAVLSDHSVTRKQLSLPAHGGNRGLKNPQIVNQGKARWIYLGLIHVSMFEVLLANAAVRRLALAVMLI